MIRLFLLMLLIIPIKLYSQTDELKRSLSGGDISWIISNLNDSVELSLPNCEGNFVKDKAGDILIDFFNSNKIDDYEYLHSGFSSKSYYFISCLVLNGVSYDIQIIIKSNKIVNIYLDLSV